jgi:hypothetical protein
MDPLEDRLRAQDGLLTRKQALETIGENALDFRLGRHWTVVLPGIYAAQTGPISSKQRLRAATLFAGGGALLTDATLLQLAGIPYVPADPTVHVVVPANNQRKSRDFVSIRRTIHHPQPWLVDGLPCVRLARALVDFAARYDDERAVLAVMAAAVQRRRVSMSELCDAATRAPARGHRRLMRCIEHLQAGVRSVPEADIRGIFEASDILPPPLYNALLELPDGRRVSPDALVAEAALVHETNGRGPHADEDPFESMQERHDAMTVAGLTVLHNSPRMVANDRARIQHQLETCFLRSNRQGLPPGVRILRHGAA